jgi:hypothetical protein
MYRFETGKFEGRTMEQAILRNAPAVYQRGAWAAENVGGKPRLAAMLGEFRRLRRLLCDAKCKSRCRESGSKRRPRWMTLEQAEGGYSPYPRFWCHKHEPSDYVYMSWKMRIELEAMRLFKELKYRKVLYKFWRPWELKRYATTEAYAHLFFETLRNRLTRPSRQQC